MTDETTTLRFTAIDDIRPMAPLKPGGVMPVSVLKSTGANVVVFAFDAGSTLREHTAQLPALIQVLEGEVVVTVDGQDVPLKPGGLLHLERHVPHSIHAAAEARVQLTVLLIDSPGPTHIPLAD
jgi:quercetin dioxygenase-like cupin family protein